MKVIFAGLKSVATKSAGKVASKTVLKRLLLSSCTNVFVSVLIWVIEFFLHPFMKRWRDGLLKKLNWDKPKEAEPTTVVEQET